MDDGVSRPYHAGGLVRIHGDAGYGHKAAGGPPHGGLVRSFTGLEIPAAALLPASPKAVLRREFLRVLADMPQNSRRSHSGGERRHPASPITADRPVLEPARPV